MYLKDKIFGFSTKNLYIGQLTQQIEKYDFKTDLTTYTALVPKRDYVLVRIKEKKYETIKYKDVFTNSVYNLVNQSGNVNDEFVVIPKCPINSSKRRIKYKDAETLIDGLNFMDEEDKIKVKR